MNIQFTIKKEQQFNDLIIFGFEDQNLPVINQYKEILSKIKKEFTGKADDILVYPVFDNKQTQRLILVGLGKSQDFKINNLAKSISNLVKVLETKKIVKFDLYWPQFLIKKFKDSEHLLTLLIKYFYLSSYKFNEYQSSKKEAVNIEKVNLLNLKETSKLNKVIDDIGIISQAINYTRDLNNQPAQKVTPKYFAAQARKMAEQNKNLRVKILETAEMKKLGMGGILGVGAGSQQSPQFIILEYFTGEKNKKPIVFIGKSITFDSGGISLKPGEGMDEMKMDMSGGGAVLGLMKAVSQLGLKTNVIALIPACENMPSGTAYKPGDILQAMNKKTIEVLNTDAEGRIILADALSYAVKYKPQSVIDLATLTGACMIALGTQRAGLFGNQSKLIDKLHKLGEEVNELLWPMPLDPEYSEQIKSKIADVRNLATSKYGGAIAAAAFLKEFTDYDWAHLDIAPVAWADDKPGYSLGATGFGVHLLVELLKK
jgi:leucyl aminopeptidase